MVRRNSKTRRCSSPRRMTIIWMIRALLGIALIWCGIGYATLSVWGKAKRAERRLPKQPRYKYKASVSAAQHAGCRQAVWVRSHRGARRDIVCEQDAPLIGCPLKHIRIACSSYLRILNANQVQFGLAAQQTAYDVVVQIFVRSKCDHGTALLAACRASSRARTPAGSKHCSFCCLVFSACCRRLAR